MVFTMWIANSIAVCYKCSKEGDLHECLVFVVKRFLNRWSSLFSVHEYNYLAPFYDPHPFRVPRMSSEYGLQSFPSMETLTPVYNESDMDYWSDLNDYRNHHPFGIH